MQLKSVNNYSEPRYLKLEHSRKNQELLNGNVPLRWKMNKSVIVFFLISFSYMFNSCNSDKKQELTIEKHVELADSNYYAPIFEHGKLTDSILIAPLFHHGIGRADYGCRGCPVSDFDKSFAAPLILAEFRKHNLILDTNFIIKKLPSQTWIDPDERRRILEEVTWDDQIDKSNKYLPKDFDTVDTAFIKNYIRYMAKDTLVNYRPIGYNREHNLIVVYATWWYDHELVSNTTACEKYLYDIGHMSTGGRKDAIGSARTIRSNLITMDKYNAVVFYDPLDVCFDFHADSLLQCQINDFFEWWGKQKQ
jgi:hypothetical protein